MERKTATKRKLQVEDCRSSTKLELSLEELKDLAKTHNPGVVVLCQEELSNYWFTLHSVKSNVSMAKRSASIALELALEQEQCVSMLQKMRISKETQEKHNRQETEQPFRAWLKSIDKPLFISNDCDESAVECRIPEQDDFTTHKVCRKRKEKFKHVVKQAVIEKKLQQVRSKFNVILKKREVPDVMLDYYDGLFDHEKISEFLVAATNEKIYVPAYSLREVYKSQQTITIENLFKILEKHQDVPTLNIIEWKYLKIKEIRDEPLNLDGIASDSIDWVYVASELWFHESWHLTPAKCRAIWDNYLSPLAEKYQINRARIRLVKDAVDCIGKRWSLVSKYAQLSPEICKALYENTKLPVLKKLQIDRKKEKKERNAKFLEDWKRLRRAAIQTYRRYNGSYWHVAAQLNNYSANSYLPSTAERLYKENLPMVFKRKTIFSVFEDAILLVTLLQLAPMVQIEGGFSCLGHYLPWRTEDEWTNRFTYLTRPWPLPNTLEEDLKLLYLVNVMPGDWMEIATYFENPCRNYLYQHYRTINGFIQKKGTLIQYHLKNGSKKTRIHYEGLKNVLRVLIPLSMQGNFKIGSEFKGFSSRRPPTKREFVHFLLSLGSNMLKETCLSIINFLLKHGRKNRPPFSKLKHTKAVKIERTKTVKVGTNAIHEVGTVNMTQKVEVANSPEELDLNWTSHNATALFNEFIMSPATSDIESGDAEATITLSPEYIFPDAPNFTELRDCDINLRQVHSNFMKPKKIPYRYNVPVPKRGKKKCRISKIRKAAAKSRWDRRKNEQKASVLEDGGGSCGSSSPSSGGVPVDEDISLYNFEFYTSNEVQLPGPT